MGSECAAIVSYTYGSTLVNCERCCILLHSVRSLRSTRVLVVGMKGVASEICKNLILSGVKSITMMDHENVSKSDLQSQYLLHPDSVGENVSFHYLVEWL